MNKKKFLLKIVRIILDDDMIKIEDSDFDNFILDEKSYENISIYKTLVFSFR